MQSVLQGQQIPRALTSTSKVRMERMWYKLTEADPGL